MRWPDLAAVGKIVGGGFPLAAVCGRQDIMRAFDPRLEGTPDFVAQVGTLNGNPIAAVAGLATLAELRKPGAYARFRDAGHTLRAITFHPIVLDPRPTGQGEAAESARGLPAPASGMQAEAILRRLAALSKALGSELRIANGAACNTAP